MKLLSIVHEDGLFGVTTYRCGGRLVSRDLLDSLFEIYFLERHLGVSEWRDATILDIGAGYGRLAHCISQAVPRLGRVLCVDAVPESTFLCEYYLRFREVDTAQAEVIPLPDIEARMDIDDVTLATNIHSFSECPLSAIRSWLALLSTHRVRYLMVVPTADRLLSKEQDGSSIDFLDEFEKRGYRLIAKDQKYLDPPVQRFGVSLTYHFLFERSE